MATRYPRTSGGQTFYNDNRTGANYDRSELATSPFTPIAKLRTTIQDVRFNLHLDIFINGMSVVKENVQVKATDFKEFRKLLRLIHQCVETAWKGTVDVETASEISFELGESKWVMMLEEDGNVVTFLNSPTRITGVDVDLSFEEASYQDWYFRNVLEGQKRSYQIVFKSHVKSDHARDMFKSTEEIPLDSCCSVEDRNGLH